MWVGSTGAVFTLPLYRIAGIYAPANGEFNTPAFTVPSTALWVNLDARWYGQLNTTYHGVRGCDEGCAAYFYASVLDAVTGQEIPGYGVEQTNPMMDVNAVQVPLQWRGGGGHGMVDTTPLVGTHVKLRLHFRDATVYAVGG